MLAYDSNTATSDNSQGQKNEAFFIETQENTTVGKSLGAFLALSALPRADWFTEQDKTKPGTTRVLKLFDFQLHFRGAEASPEDTKAELHG